MKRIALLLGFAVFLLMSTSAAAAECQFVLGFKTLRDLIGQDIVGECLENEHHGANGDSLQQTTGGLMVWRKADNWTAFTDGYRTWVYGPNGLEQRLNTEFLAWEAENAIAALPWVKDGLEGYYEHEMVQSFRTLQQASPHVFRELFGKPWLQPDVLYSGPVHLPFLYRHILSMTRRDEAAALRIIRMPFMDDLGYSARTAWTTLIEVYDYGPEGFERLLAHPSLENGITNDRIASLPLLHLETLQPESASALQALPWIH